VTLLIDTHVLLWWIGTDRRISSRVAKLIGDPDCEVLVSTATVWEIAIKAALGQLDMPPDLGSFLRGEMAANGFKNLPITFEHAVSVRDLPPHHRDPFDRLLITQSQIEGVALASSDRRFRLYDVELVW